MRDNKIVQRTENGDLVVFSTRDITEAIRAWLFLAGICFVVGAYSEQHHGPVWLTVGMFSAAAGSCWLLWRAICTWLRYVSAETGLIYGSKKMRK